jgi:hypothetical protein
VFCEKVLVLINRLLKNPLLTFDKLRANGGNIEMIDFNSFVVSMSNHSKHFFNNLLKLKGRIWLAGTKESCSRPVMGTVWQETATTGKSSNRRIACLILMGCTSRHRLPHHRLHCRVSMRYKTFRPWMTLINITMIASTSRIWMNPPMV